MVTPHSSELTGGLRQRALARLLQWWSGEISTPVPRLVAPSLRLASAVYSLGLARDQKKALLRSRRLPAYVISVGNLVVGGTGKTPVTLWVAEFLYRRGLRVAILSRGYGRRHADAARVPESGETMPLVHLYGDEPVLMARKLPGVPVWVGRERYHAGLLAMEAIRPQVLVLDDGFQHLALKRDLDLVLLDACSPFGNGRLLPGGPLREPVEHLGRASAFLLTRAENLCRARATREMLAARFPEKPVFTCRHHLTGTSLDSGTASPVPRLPDAGQVGAFAGIAHPDSFFEALRAKGIKLAQTWSFPDHHAYGREDFTEVLEGVGQHGIRALMTTEKDYVRLPTWLQHMTWPIGLDLDFGPDHQAFQGFLEGCLEKSGLA